LPKIGNWSFRRESSSSQIGFGLALVSGEVVKPYLSIPIQECGEPLVAIPGDGIALVDPHPYVVLGAPYGDKSPYFLRQGVLRRLLQASALLQSLQPTWHIQVFDAYRPIPVQQFMVEHAYGEMLRARGLEERSLTKGEQQAILAEVYEFWAIPSSDPATPPPHSTGAALDVTLVSEAGVSVEMGSPIDELSPRSFPDYFAPDSPDRPVDDQTPLEDCDRFHQNRQLLYDVMQQAGFQRHPKEWWHFSFGDQLWAWLTRKEVGNAEEGAIACYGCI